MGLKALQAGALATQNVQAAGSGSAYQIGTTAVTDVANVSPNSTAGQGAKWVTGLLTYTSEVGLALSVGVPELFAAAEGIFTTATLFHDSSLVSGEIEKMNGQTTQVVAAYQNYSDNLTKYATTLGNEAQTVGVQPEKSPINWWWLGLGLGGLWLLSRPEHKKEERAHG